jgi:hypothetical protein
MKRLLFSLAAVALLAAGAGRAQAGLIFYTDRTTFNAANPGLPVETFEEANVASGSFVLVNSPINSTTSDAAFPSGISQPGLTISDLGGPSTQGLAVLGAGTIQANPPTTKSVATSTFPAAVDLAFSPTVTAVGTDVSAAPGPNTPTAKETFEVDVFGPNGLLGQTTVSEDAGAIAFFGVSTTGGDVISAITLHARSNANSTGVDNIAFGAAGVPPAVTEPATLALAGIGALCVAGYSRRKKAGA